MEALSAEQRRLLGRLLGEHEPVDAAEKESLERIRAFVESVPDPFDRSVDHAHLTGSSFVLDDGGRVLLTHHRRLDMWLELGGHAEGERVAHEVAMREAEEESGLEDLRFETALLFDDGTPRLLDVDVHEIPARGEEAAHEHHDLRFVLRTSKPADVRADPRETKALEWVDLVEASRRLDASGNRALGRIRQLL